VTAVGGAPKEFAETIKGDIDRWRVVVKQANIKVE